MRFIFMAFCKLIGIIAIVTGLFSFSASLAFLHKYFDHVGQTINSTIYLIAGLAAVLFALAFGLLLIFRTSRLADALLPGDGSLEHAEAPRDTILESGVILLGIFLFVRQVPSLAGSLCSLFYPESFHHSWIKPFALVIGLTLSMGLVLKAPTIVRWIRDQEAKMNRSG